MVLLRIERQIVLRNGEKRYDQNKWNEKSFKNQWEYEKNFVAQEEKFVSPICDSAKGQNSAIIEFMMPKNTVSIFQAPQSSKMC